MMPTLQTDEWKTAYREQAETAGRRGREYGVWLIEQCAPDTLCPSDAEEIVADALGDIWIGRVSWDHQAVGLTRAVQDVVRYRVRDLIERVCSRVPLSADGEPDVDDDEDGPGRIASRDVDRITERLSTEDLRDVIERRDLARRAIAELRTRIKESKVGKLLDVLIGTMDNSRRPSRPQLARRLHVSVDEVYNLERRLLTYAVGLPAALRIDGVTAPTPRARRRRRVSHAGVLDLARMLGCQADTSAAPPL